MVAISGDGSIVDLGAIHQFLQELRIDTGTIDGILAALGDGQDRAASLDLPQVPPQRFGTLPNGTSLGHHTELARQAIARAISTMVHDLQHFDDGVTTFRKGANLADEHAREDLDQITMSINSVQSDTEGGLKP